jgi:putative acetyltransferase
MRIWWRRSGGKVVSVDLEVFVRPEEADDLATIFRVHAEAFGQDTEARLVDELRRQRSYDSGMSLVGIVGGAIVGHVLFSRVEIVNGPQRTPALALAPLAVLPSHQRRGVGTKLVETGLDVVSRLGHKLVIVLGHPDYYSRFGFVPASPQGIHPPFPAPPEAFRVLELNPGARAEVCGVVEYPTAFSVC